MANRFRVADEVFMRDKGDESWAKGVVTSVDPLMIRFDHNPPTTSGHSFDEVKPRSIETGEVSMEDARKNHDQVSAPASEETTALRKVTLLYFDPEDPQFWSKEGKKVAYVNLAVSTLALFLGFAIWAQWGAVVLPDLVEDF